MIGGEFQLFINGSNSKLMYEKYENLKVDKSTFKRWQLDSRLDFYLISHLCIVLFITIHSIHIEGQFSFKGGNFKFIEARCLFVGAPWSCKNNQKVEH